MVHSYLCRIQQSRVGIERSDNRLDHNETWAVLLNHLVDRPGMDTDFCLWVIKKEMNGEMEMRKEKNEKKMQKKNKPSKLISKQTFCHSSLNNIIKRDGKKLFNVHVFIENFDYWTNSNWQHYCRFVTFVASDRHRMLIMPSIIFFPMPLLHSVACMHCVVGVYFHDSRVKWIKIYVNHNEFPHQLRTRNSYQTDQM